MKYDPVLNNHKGMRIAYLQATNRIDRRSRHGFEHPPTLIEDSSSPTRGFGRLRTEATSVASSFLRYTSKSLRFEPHDTDRAGLFFVAEGDCRRGGRTTSCCRPKIACAIFPPFEPCRPGSHVKTKAPPCGSAF